MQKRATWSVIDTSNGDAIVSEHETREEAIAACPPRAITEDARYVAACPWDGLKSPVVRREPTETEMCS